MSRYQPPCRPINGAQPRSRGRRGAVTVETALALPICVLMLLGILEYGRFAMVRNVLTNAAREGARYAAVNTATATTANVQAVVQQFLAGQGAQLGSLTIQVNAADDQGNLLSGVSWNDATFGDTIAVQISGTYSPVTPAILLMPSLVQLQVTALANSEAN